MMVEERLNVLLVEERSALGAGQNKVQMQEKTHPRVEWYPAKDKVEGVLHHHEAREHDEVDEPWCE